MSDHPFKRFIFWTLLIAAVALSVLWCFHFPFNATRIYRAIPSNFLCMSRHANLADRWQDLLQQPALEVAADSIGVTRHQLGMIRNAPEIDKLVRWLGPRETIFAYVPLLGDTGKPGWIASSWVGDRGRLLTLLADRGEFEGLKRVESKRRTAIYSMRMSDSSFGQFLSMSVYEGVWLACLSDNAEGVRCLVDRVSANSMIVDQLLSGLEGRDKDADQEAQDRAWIRWFENSSHGSRMQEIRMGLRSVSNGNLRGWARSDMINVPRPPLSQMSGLENLAGAAPQTVVVLPALGVLPWLARNRAPRDVLSVANTLSSQLVVDSPLVIGLHGDDYSGKMYGIRTPALICAWRCKNADDVAAITADVLDDLNARHGWTLIPRNLEMDGHSYVAIDTTANGVYSSLRDEEKAGLTAVGDWVIMSTSMRTLQQLRNDGVREGISSLFDEASQRASEVGLAPEQAALFGECDISATAKSLRNAVAVGSLVLITQPRAGGGLTRAHLAEARRWLTRLDGLGDCSIWVNNREADVEIVFDLISPLLPL